MRSDKESLGTVLTATALEAPSELMVAADLEGEPGTMSTATASDARSVFASLREGDRIKVTQEVRVGSRRWRTTTTGTVVKTERLRSGLHFNRAADDPVYSDTILLKRDDGELTTVNLDEQTQLEVLRKDEG
jgi:hypothetical protein